MAGLGIEAYLSPTFRDTAGRFTRFSGSEQLKKLVKEAGEETTRALKEATPVRTGKAQAGWRATYLLGDEEVRITQRVPYALFLVTGTKSHVIEPRNASVLHFTAGGKDVFTRRVQHPGTRPNPALTQAIADIPNRVRLLVGKAGIEIRRSLVG